MTASHYPHVPTASIRGTTAPASPIRKLTPYAVAARERGVLIHHMNIGQPDFATPGPIRAAIAHFKEETIAYAPSQGMSEAIEGWSRYFEQACGVRVPDDELLVTVGGSEAIQFALMAVADPGDDVLVFDPSYTNYCGFAGAAGVLLRPCILEQQDGYALPTAERICASMTDKTRAILFCNPNNPTGAVYSESDLRMLVDIAEQRGIFLIVDEVYRELVFDGLPQATILSVPGAMKRAILVDSVSKRFNACGARIGCLTTANRSVLGAVMRFAQARLSAPTVEQLALVPLLRESLAYTATLSTEYERRRDAALAALSRIPEITFSRPQGAFYIILQLPIPDAEDFARWLLESYSQEGETVMVAPLEGFYVTPNRGRSEVRLAFVLEEERLARAIEIFGNGLNEFRTTVGVRS